LKILFFNFFIFICFQKNKNKVYLERYENHYYRYWLLCSLQGCHPISTWEKIMNTSDEWIRQRTGIVERRYADEGVGTSDLAAEAAKRALEAAQLKPEDIEFIIAATLSPDHYFPGIGVLVQAKLGLAPIGALDIRNQCSGFIYALSVADPIYPGSDFPANSFSGG
jgi:3-oxoacyl-[acyl-carrier-protein] synthase III